MPFAGVQLTWYRFRQGISYVRGDTCPILDVATPPMAREHTWVSLDVVLQPSLFVVINGDKRRVLAAFYHYSALHILMNSFLSCIN